MEEEILNEEKILNHKDYTQFKKINNKNYKIYHTYVYGFNKNDSERSTEFEIIYKKNLNFNDISQLINIKDNEKKNLDIEFPPNKRLVYVCINKDANILINEIFQKNKNICGVNIYNINANHLKIKTKKTKERELDSYIDQKSNEEVYQSEIFHYAIGFDISNIFLECSNLKIVKFFNRNSYLYTDMSSMFSDCKNLSIVNLKPLITRNVVNMSSMFKNCINLKFINVGFFDTNNVKDMSYMFFNCENLESLDFSSNSAERFNNLSFPTRMLYCQDDSNHCQLTLNGSPMYSMTYACEYSNKYIYYSFTANNTDLSYIFSGCKNLKYLNIKNFKLNCCSGITSMFENCTNLKNIKLPIHIEIHGYPNTDYIKKVPIKKQTIIMLNHARKERIKLEQKNFIYKELKKQKKSLFYKYKLIEQLKENQDYKNIKEKQSYEIINGCYHYNDLFFNSIPKTALEKLNSFNKIILENNLDKKILKNVILININKSISNLQKYGELCEESINFKKIEKDFINLQTTEKKIYLTLYKITQFIRNCDRQKFKSEDIQKEFENLYNNKFQTFLNEYCNSDNVNNYINEKLEKEYNDLINCINKSSSKDIESINCKISQWRIYRNNILDYIKKGDIINDYKSSKIFGLEIDFSNLEEKIYNFNILKKHNKNNKNNKFLKDDELKKILNEKIKKWNEESNKKPSCDSNFKYSINNNCLQIEEEEIEIDNKTQGKRKRKRESKMGSKKYKKFSSDEESSDSSDE